MSAADSTAHEPAFSSLVLEEMPEPDWADVVLMPLPRGAGADPGEWARAVFDPRSMPRWVLALLTLRQALVRLLGIPRAAPSVFDVRRVVGEEVHGWRGRLYFLPVRLLHDPITRSMLHSAGRRLGAGMRG